MTKDTSGRGGVRIPELRVEGGSVTAKDAAIFLHSLVYRNNFSFSPANRPRRPNPFGYHNVGFENPYDELFLPADRNRPAGLIRHRIHTPLDRTLSGTSYYDFLTAPKKGRAGSFTVALAFQHYTGPEQWYHAHPYVEALDARTDEDYARLKILATERQVQDLSELDRETQTTEQEVLGKIMSQCVAFLAKD